MLDAWMSRAATWSLAVVVMGSLSVGCADNKRGGPSGGACTPVCGSFQMCCRGSEGGSTCKATTNDPSNCGGCGVVCPSGRCTSGMCVGGSDAMLPPRPDGAVGGDCTPICSSAQRCCGVSCVNRSLSGGGDGRSDSSFQHCNGCGIQCDATRASACSTPFGMGGAPSCLCGDFPQCAPGELCAADASGTFRCSNTSTDPTHCGDPPVACAEGESCSGGVCGCGGGAACGAGQACCGATCVDVTSDAANCGACGNVCGSNAPDCSGGTCGCGAGPACAAPTAPSMPGLPGGSLGESCCTGTCVANDTNNCGGCGMMCSSGESCIMASGGLPFPGLPMGTGVCCGTEIPLIGGLCSGGFPMGDGGIGLGDGGLPFP